MKRNGDPKPGWPARLAAGLSEDALGEALGEIGLGPKDWDVLLVGDGSGQGWDAPCGWGCVRFDNGDPPGPPRVYGGCSTRGTVNFAEASAYLAPLGELVAAKPPGAPARVHVVTDSDYVKAVGSGPAHAVAANPGVWAAFASYARCGVLVRLHWVRRETLEANRYADALSKRYRRLAAGEAGP